MRRATAHLPLHTGKAPPWLFDRMWRLAGAVTMAVVDDYGPAEMLRRLEQSEKQVESEDERGEREELPAEAHRLGYQRERHKARR